MSSLLSEYQTEQQPQDRETKSHVSPYVSYYNSLRNSPAETRMPTKFHLLVDTDFSWIHTNF
jgi:hypothetical protein